MAAGRASTRTPYTPLGGWYNPNADPDAATSAMWFQEDWVHADYRAPGSDLFLQCERYFDVTRAFYDTQRATAGASKAWITVKSRAATRR